MAGASVPFLYPFTFWTLRGMETGLLALLSLMIAWAVVEQSARHGWGLGIAGCAAAAGVLTRLDFASIAVVLAVAGAMEAPDTRGRARVAAAILVPTGCAVGAVVLFQHAYYGDWLPNTYYLKLEGFTALDRLQRGVVTIAKALPFLWLVALGSVASFRAGPPSRAVGASLGAVTVVACIYSTYVGGDAWEWSPTLNR